MLCKVTLHRRNGQRLKKDELAPAILANMQMHELAAEHSNMRRTVRRLTLTEYPGNSLRILAVLLDPQLIGMDETSMQYQGIELEARDGQVFEYVQIWNCRPVPTPA
jgi:hypothetical protein